MVYGFRNMINFPLPICNICNKQVASMNIEQSIQGFRFIVACHGDTDEFTMPRTSLIGITAIYPGKCFVDVV